MKDKIIEGLRKLNVENDNHWTADGLPKIEALKFTVGPSVTREDVNSVAPGFTRSNPVIEEAEHEEKHDTSSMQETEQTEVVADTDNAQYESLSKVEADKETVNGKSIVTTRIAFDIKVSDAVKAMLQDIPVIDFDNVSVEELKQHEKDLSEQVNADNQMLSAMNELVEARAKLYAKVNTEIERRKPKTELAHTLASFRDQMAQVPHVVNQPRMVVRNGIRTR